VTASALDSLSPGERARWWRLRFAGREWITRSLVVVPALYIVAALLLAEGVARSEGKRDTLSLGIAPDTALTFLSAVAGGMIAFTGLVVSVALLVVQFGASQYTPRLVGLFRRDPIVKHALGIFIAPAICALVSMRYIGENKADVVPSLTMTVNLVLLIAAVVAFFLLVSRLLDLLRPRVLVGRLVRLGAAAAADVYPFALGQAPHLPLPFEEAAERLPVRHTGRPGVLAALDRGELVRVGERAGAVVELTRGIGAYVPTGAVLFVVHGGADERAVSRLRRAAILSQERTTRQDPAFAIRAIVDIALRALSPAVNDPTTGVNAVDGLESLLLFLAGRDLERGRITDASGRVRLVYPTPDWPALLELALAEIRHYGADSPQVARKLRSTLVALRRYAPESRAPELDDQLARLDARISELYGDERDRAAAAVADSMGFGAPGT
jgi:uncharacterized membrane protein